MSLHNKIVLQIAKEKGIHPTKVEKIVSSQFKLIKEKIAEDEPCTIMIPYLGKYQTTEKRFNRYRENIKKKYGHS